MEAVEKLKLTVDQNYTLEEKAPCDPVVDAILQELAAL